MKTEKLLDAALRINLTSHFGRKAIDDDILPDKEVLARFLLSVESLTDQVVGYLMEDNNISEWEVEQRCKDVYNRMVELSKEAANEQA